MKPKPPQWLRKASGSGLAALRSKSRSPKGNDEPLPAVPSLPPALPPRKNQSASTADRGAVLPPTPPPVPQKPLDLSETQARPDRSSTVGPADRPAPPARKASRDNIGRRIAAWTANAHSAFPRSASSASLTSQASTQSTFNASHQRSHSQAQKVLDGAGAAMQKGLAGLKARGMSGSISSLSSIGGNGRAQHTRQGSAGPSSGWTSGFGTRSSKDHARSTTGLASTSEGPEFEDAIVMRLAIPGCRPIFGHDLVEAGNATHVMDANAGDAMERQRRHCLPAVVVRCVEYRESRAILGPGRKLTGVVEIWGPKEEGIFRISGRSSHIARLKKEFDSGADIDMRQCHPGDLDPHAVAGLFKLYLRDLPSSVLTPQLLPLFDAYGKAKHGLTAPLLSVNDLDREVEHVPDEVDSLLAQLPPAHWFLIADIGEYSPPFMPEREADQVVKLLDLIPRHEQVNRMTPNALMISLGPSVNIPGGILTEFLTRRKHLFAKPPSTKQDTVTDLIDFGNVDIAPPSIPQATMFPLKPESPLRSSTPHSQLSEDSPPFKVNKPQRMSSKPSLTRLFTASSRNLTQAEEEPVVPPSAVNPEPPRVDLTIDEMSPLPNFGKVPSPVHPPPELPSTSSADDHTPTQETEEKKLEDILHPTPGMVQERIKAYPTSSTPIADRFAKAEAGLPPLRPNSLSSSISTVSAGKASHDNPATIVKRGQSPFFSGPGISPRSSHSRAQSGTLLDKRSSTSSSVREMVRDMERRD